MAIWNFQPTNIRPTNKQAKNLRFFRQQENPSAFAFGSPTIGKPEFVEANQLKSS